MQAYDIISDSQSTINLYQVY